MKKYLATCGLNNNGIPSVSFPFLAGDKIQSFVKQTEDEFNWFDDLEEAKRYIRKYPNKTLFEIDMP